MKGLTSAEMDFSHWCSRSVNQNNPNLTQNLPTSISVIHNLGSALTLLGSFQKAQCPGHIPHQSNPHLWSSVLGSLPKLRTTDLSFEAPLHTYWIRMSRCQGQNMYLKKSPWVILIYKVPVLRVIAKAISQGSILKKVITGSDFIVYWSIVD